MYFGLNVAVILGVPRQLAGRAIRSKLFSLKKRKKGFSLLSLTQIEI